MRFVQHCNELRCKRCPAVNSCIFSVLSEDCRQKIEGELHFFPCRDGKIIFRQGDRVRGVHILCQGGAKLLLGTQDGRRILVRFCHPGEILNGIAAQKHAFSAVSVGASTISFISKAKAVELIKQHPNLGLEIDNRFAQNGKLLLQRMADLAYENVEERLAHILLSLGQRYGVHEQDGLRIDPSSTVPPGGVAANALVKGAHS